MRAGRIRGRAVAGLLGALSLGAVYALLWAPCALAAPPANDDFANAEPLSGALPIEAARSNVEATKEAGENLPGLSPAGHSVWFEWEATSSGYVTIGSCEAGFPTMLDVFTGTALNSLARVGGGNSSEGPHCPNTGREVTFKATEGTAYKIAVDGDSFYVPPAEPPSTEGEFTLRIETTPPPPNDDFAGATALAGSIDEEPGGDRSYFASAEGDNWNATTEAGEPFYGTNSGASVWYSWTAPESGVYRFNGPCCGSGLNWSLFAGNSLGELTEVLAATGPAAASLPAGVPYWISVWGTPDLVTEEPSMSSFNFLISAELTPRWLLEALQHPPGLPPAPRAAGPSSPAGTAPPDTKIFEHVLRRRPPIFAFSFHSSKPGSTFRCKLDKNPFRDCPSSERFGNLKPGRHVLKVLAVDAAGTKDPTPAVVWFRIPGGSRGPIRSMG
jgi:hypothetical protein